ncbi:hypothetical protein BJF85_16770 [Saccharomonospora sp. CUA-673]|uniref:hypothetical protein n=1 Tax=Saccharomonospora sp. CUA-673 TaxID=1904969 RepID=UPI0009608B9C|nr:hypothetical protein [Saccharomonospora sp. CUA-673]OLT46496.1 hypothetical protein BJF85_16770 [Saccharomonospora sp. CUA-673]
MGALANAVDDQLEAAQTENRQARELLIPYADTIALPQVRNPTRATYNDWGGLITFPNPGGPVLIMAWGSGNATNDDAGSQFRMRIGISTDGGSSYAWGSPAVDQSGGGASTRRAGFSPIHMLSTSDPAAGITVRAQNYWTDSSNTATDLSFDNGRIIALVIPQG